MILLSQVQSEHKADAPSQIENNQLIFTKPNNHKNHTVKGDISKLKYRYNIEVDAIVNAANQQLDTRGEVCGVIFRTSHGPRLQQEYHNFQLIEGNVRCEAGNTVAIQYPGCNRNKYILLDQFIAETKYLNSN